MKISKTRSMLLSMLLLPVVVGGCRYREPIGGCPFEDIEISASFMTPWGTTLEQDMAQIMGPHRGTFYWRDGEEVIMVPKAGEEFEADAIVEIDPATTTMRLYESTEETPACELDILFMEATVTFVRVDDGEVMLTTSVTVDRDTESSKYHGEAEIMPIVEFAPGLVPLLDFDTESVTTQMSWGMEGDFRAEYDYYGRSTDSGTTGHGASKMIAEFATPD